ncbi:hypothetical protein CRYUN_Cryun40dG0084600 [Craigia yunnanensis]
MEIVLREGENALSGSRPMEWATVLYAPKGPDRNGNKRKSSLESPIMFLTSAIYTTKFYPAGTVVASDRMTKKFFYGMSMGTANNFMVLEAHKNAVLDLHWTTDGSQIISASLDKIFREWDVETGKQIKKMAEHTSFVNSSCPSRGEPPLVVSGSDDGTAKLWDMHQRGAIQTFPDKYQITAVGFSDFSANLDQNF